MGSRGQNFDRVIEQLQQAFDSHAAVALLDGDAFLEMLKRDPDAGLEELVKRYNSALDTAYTDDDGVNNRYFVEAVCGGPAEGVPSAFYNAVGVLYPFWRRGTRDKAIGKILNILDGINSGYVQLSHTAYIHEPLLLSDIAIQRGLYWPGLEIEIKRIKKFPLFVDFHAELMDDSGLFRKGVNDSDFLMAYTALRSDTSPFNAEYADATEPDFLSRVLQGIVGLRFAWANKGDYEKWTERLRQLLPEQLHAKTMELRDAGDWTNPRLYNHNSSHLPEEKQ